MKFFVNITFLLSFAVIFASAENDGRGDGRDNAQGKIRGNARKSGPKGDTKAHLRTRELKGSKGKSGSSSSSGTSFANRQTITPIGATPRVTVTVTNTAATAGTTVNNIPGTTVNNIPVTTVVNNIPGTTVNNIPVDRGGATGTGVINTGTTQARPQSSNGLHNIIVAVKYGATNAGDISWTLMDRTANKLVINSNFNAVPNPFQLVMTWKMNMTPGPYELLVFNRENLAPGAGDFSLKLIDATNLSMETIVDAQFLNANPGRILYTHDGGFGSLLQSSIQI